MRHAGILSALLLTAALLCAMPGLARLPHQDGRADDSLRPAQVRPLTVWLMPGDVSDRKLLSQLCARFEKERPGVRVFLRVVTADEFTGENAVLPDAALFETGGISMPEKVFLPLSDVSSPSGCFSGTQYAYPLWLAPNVFSLPQRWLKAGASSASQQQSLLASATAAPAQESSGVLHTDELPWETLLLPGAVAHTEGVGWQQLLSACPSELRAKLVSGVLNLHAATPAPDGAWVTTLPKAAPPDLSTPAKLETLAQHRARVQKGEALAAYVPETAVSHHVRYAALCRNNEDARAFLQFLIQHRGMAVEHSLLPQGAENLPGDALMQALLQSYQSAALPNAFAHTKTELVQLCEQDFARCIDPMQTLLRLR